MRTVRDRYDLMIKERLGPHLREKGFRRTRNTFARAVSGGWQLIGFQASQWGSRDHVRFTINLGVAYPEARGEADTWSEAKPPSEVHAHLRTRVGPLMPDPRDHWWDFVDGTDVKSLSDMLLALIGSVALPWLEDHRDFGSLIAVARDHPSSLNGYELMHLQRCFANAGEEDLVRTLRDEQQRRARGVETHDHR